MPRRPFPPETPPGLRDARVAIPVPNHPGQLFIPALGRTFEQVVLVPVTYSWSLNQKGHMDMPVDAELERAIFSVGAKPGHNWQVWTDERLEKGDVTASQLSVRINGTEVISLALMHLDFFWPQLHDLEKVPVQWARNTMLSIRGPPFTIVTISGIEKRPLTR